MGKVVRLQRRGKGSPKYRAPSHKYVARVRYKKNTKGRVVDIVHARGRKSPLAIVDMKGNNEYVIASEGQMVGDEFDVVTLSEVSEGARVFNIEINPGDGGKLCRTAGTGATVVSHEKGRTMIMLPSRQKKILRSNCRACLGYVAGGGRGDKPFRKAGNKFFEMKATGKMYPRTKGVVMNSVDHPFGGSARPGKHKTVSRDMPPGKKVGSVSARRTGKRK